MHISAIISVLYIVICISHASISPLVGSESQIPTMPKPQTAATPSISAVQKVVAISPGPSKYFQESSFGYHYDKRFACKQQSEENQVKELKLLIESYLFNMKLIGAETWIAHGSLLGWWWNAKILPWDSDLDVQVTEPTMRMLASYYNMTMFSSISPERTEQRYLLDINPHYVIGDQSDRLNRIDGRWVDTWTGLFIDMTVTRRDGNGGLNCKDGHRYKENHIFPLKESYFEGQSVKVPRYYEQILIAEYGKQSLSSTTFNGYQWDDTMLLWKKEIAKTGPRRPHPGKSMLS